MSANRAAEDDPEDEPGELTLEELDLVSGGTQFTVSAPGPLPPVTRPVAKVGGPHL